MMRSRTRTGFLVVVVMLAGCMSVPTLPVPPPVDSSALFPLSAPNENGIVCVDADAYAVPPETDVHGIRVRVTNLDTLEWVEEDVRSDGSFNICIYAESGHTLAIQAVYPYGGVSESVDRTVP
jgi:hypothetical protein